MDIVITAQLTVPENDLQRWGWDTSDEAVIAERAMFVLEEVVPPQMQEGLNVIAERREHERPSGPDIDAL